MDNNWRKPQLLDQDLVDFLEKRLDGLQDSDSIELNGFEDSDLAMYPAIAIPEINLSADQCELVANTLIGMMETLDQRTMVDAVRAVSVLAYNALMNPGGRQVPFFHLFDKTNHRESWLRTTGVSAVDLRELCESWQLGAGPQSAGAGPRLRLVNRDASEFERKCTIGYWAFTHLRAIGNATDGEQWRNILTSKFDRRQFEQFYGFQPAYECPRPSAEVSQLFVNTCCKNKIGEQVYLFYRAAIVLENIYHDSRYKIRRDLLLFAAFDLDSIRPVRFGLRYAGLNLWLRCRLASERLGISIGQLCDDLEWALVDPRWSKYSAASVKIVAIIRQFHDRYENQIKRKSRYYMYAHAVNFYYFYRLSLKPSKEIVAALGTLASPCVSRDPNLSGYQKWGELIAAKIRTRYMNRPRLL